MIMIKETTIINTIKQVITNMLSIGIFGLNGFFLLLWKSKHNSSLVYVIWCATVIYIFILIYLHKFANHEKEERISWFGRIRFIFRWLYVLIYLTIILINMKQLGNGHVDLSNSTLVFQWIMFIFIALTIPRDRLLRKVIASLKQKYHDEKHRFSKLSQ